MVEARPRSGFYIKSRNQLPEPSPQPLRLEASPVEVGKLRYQAFSAGSSKNVIPLSVAVPSPEVLPTAKLGRMISVIGRSASAEVVGYTEAAGHPKLRKQLARRANDWGCLLTSDDFIVTNGAAKHRIAVAPGCIFSANGRKFRNCLRISCGYPWSPQIEAAIKILGQLAR
jgi:DNA-binding transcriptional MocR family regulator